MRKAPLQESEVWKFKNSSLDKLDFIEKNEFDDLTSLAAQICKCPMAAIHFFNKDEHLFLSTIGFEVKDISQTKLFYAHNFSRNKAQIVESSINDGQLLKNPLTIKGELVHFFAAYPVVSSEGINIGMVCVMNPKPNKLSAEQKTALSFVAGQVSRLLELRLKNNFITNHAKNQLDVEQKTIQHNIKERDNERVMIGTELHENFAQVLAAISLYLNISQQTEDKQENYIYKAKELVDYLLEDIRNLSKIILPTTLKDSSLRTMTNDFINRFRNTVLFDIQLVWTGEEIRGKSAFSMFRVIEDWLQVIKENDGVSYVEIEVTTNSNSINLIIKDDGVTESTTEMKLTLNTIINRISMYNGRFNIQNCKQKGRKLLVEMPLERLTHD